MELQENTVNMVSNCIRKKYKSINTKSLRLPTGTTVKYFNKITRSALEKFSYVRKLFLSPSLVCPTVVQEGMFIRFLKYIYSYCSVSGEQ